MNRAGRKTLLAGLVVAAFAAGYFVPPVSRFPGNAALAGNPELSPQDTYHTVLQTIRTDYAPQKPGAKPPDPTRLT